MFDTFPRFPRYHENERKRSVCNEAYVEQNARRNSEDFAQECVRIHNHFRAQHECPPLRLSYSISAISQEWANRISSEDHFHHSNHTQYGENLFVIYMSNSSTPVLTAQQVVESWYSEHAFYPIDGHITRDTISKVGHFTQVIWSNSRELGIGKAISKNNRLYVVANYYPAGNILRKFAENVPPKVQNYSHMPLYYNRRVSSRIDVDTSTENQHVPQYHRTSSRQLGVDSNMSRGTLHVPQQYARKVSNQHLDVDTSAGTFQVPHHYTTKISNRYLDTAIETLHIPQLYNKRKPSKEFDTNDFSAETLHVPQYYTTRNPSKQFDTNDFSAETLHVPQYYTTRKSSKQFDTNDFSAETLHVPQYYTTRNSSKQFDTNDFSAETLHVPQYYTTRKSSKQLIGKDSIENSQTPYHNNSQASSRQYHFDEPIKTLYIPQYYTRKASRRH